jgi:SAM-dependent methyltransferase
VLRSVVHDADLLARFASGERLPEGHGRGLDERIVELPWTLAHLPAGPQRLLDAGSSLNLTALLELPRLAEKRLHVVTLAHEEGSFWKAGVSYVFEDLRALPFKDAIYDVVVSVSTIEHVGCDNTFYTGTGIPPEARADDFVLAVREMSRVLRPGGLFLMTVPYGAYEFHGAFQQFDRERLSQAEHAFGSATETTECFFRYSPEGWQLAADEECADCRYVAWVADVMRTGRWPEVPRLEPDGAAAARAVACVRMVKK